MRSAFRAVRHDVLGALGEVVASDRADRPHDERAGLGVYQLLRLPGFRVLLSTDPAVNEVAFLNSEEAFGRNRKQFEAIVGSSALSEDPTTPAWAEKRAAIDAHMGPHMRAVHQRAMRAEIAEKLNELRAGDLVDLFGFTQRIAFGTMARLLIGDGPSQETMIHKATLDRAAVVMKEEAVQLVFNPLVRADALREHLIPRLYPRFAEAVRQLGRATNALIEIERSNIAAGKPSNSFMTGLLTPIDYKGRRVLLSEHEIMGEFITLILAGSVTTGNTMARMLHLMAKHEAVGAQVRAEALAFLDASAAASEILPNQLPFTFAVISETLRMYPSVALAVREMKRPVRIGDAQFERGDTVLLDIYHAMTDDRIFPDPQQFNPERFSRGLQGLTPVQKHAYRPFGHGPTICPGRNFALQEICWLQLCLAERGLALGACGYPDPVPSGDVTMEPRKGTVHNLVVRASTS